MLALRWHRSTRYRPLKTIVFGDVADALREEVDREKETRLFFRNDLRSGKLESARLPNQDLADERYLHGFLCVNFMVF